MKGITTIDRSKPNHAGGETDVKRLFRANATGSLLVLAGLALLAGCPPTEPPSGPPISPPSPSVTTPTGPSVTTPLAPSVTTPLDAIPDFSEPAAPAMPDEPAPAAAMKLVPIEIELPAPAFRGTPSPQDEPNVEKPLGKPRAPFLAPEGTVNLARGKRVTCSDPMPAAGEVDYVVDGDKEASDFGYLEPRPGTEWVQIDLGNRSTIYAVVVWHNHAEARVYRDVIVQVSDDPDFLDAQTIFNNDYDNTSGLGIGPDKGYVETSEGKLIDAKGVEGRYVRLSSRGNHMENKNHYTEVAVYGKPVG